MSPPTPTGFAPRSPPLNFVDGKGYVVIRGVVEAKDCEVGWNKVMKVWGSGEHKVVGKNFELLFNAGLSEEQAKVLMVGYQKWRAESPGATVCCLCMRSRALCLATFGTSSAIDGEWIGAVAIGAIYRTITGDTQVPDYGLHGVLRVPLCGINGTRVLIVQLTGKSPATVARTMLQPILDAAPLAA